MPVQAKDLSTIFSTLIHTTHLVDPPVKPQNALLTATIADLQLHPTLEALLHILNHDLPSAHFLVRHMQAAPAVEGMLLHGILHRAEGDFDNARAWISDVQDACEGYVPKKKAAGEKLEGNVLDLVRGKEGKDDVIDFVYRPDEEGKVKGQSKDKAQKLVDDVQAWRRRKWNERKDEDGKEIEDRIRREAERLLEWCKSKFGGGEWKDATKAWVKNSEEINKMSGDMVSGGKGYRDF